MKPAVSPQRVNIRPGVTVLSVLRHLNYRPWYAMAEFVDNSLQSYLTCRETLRQVEGEDFRLKVDIEVDGADSGLIVVRDNAAGIHEQDYPRAFRPAAAPADKSGLCEFGMGMKSAACWFADRWSVTTAALGESTEKTVFLDIEAIVQDGIEELDVRTRQADPQQHYTEVRLWNLHQKPHGRAIGKIKEHLASIYREFIRQGVLELRYNGDLLAYDTPDALEAPYYADPDGDALVWRKDIDFDFGMGLRAHGFAAIRKTASTRHAGFALFRRQRLIEGSGDETYRPEFIFGHSNSYTYQRLFGELHLEGFQISHTKDGFRWDEHEQAFLELLRDELDADPLPLLRQAEGHRVRPKRADLKAGAETATDTTARVVETKVPPVLAPQLVAEPDPTPPPTELPHRTLASKREITVALHGVQWQVVLELTDDPGVTDWLTVSDNPDHSQANRANCPRRLGVRVALAHPFMDRFGGVTAEDIEPLLRVAVAIALGETSARQAGVSKAGTIRHNVNQLLREALCEP